MRAEKRTRSKKYVSRLGRTGSMYMCRRHKPPIWVIILKMNGSYSSVPRPTALTPPRQRFQSSVRPIVIPSQRCEPVSYPMPVRCNEVGHGAENRHTSFTILPGHPQALVAMIS